MCAIEVGAVLSRGTPPPPQLIYVFAGSAGNFRSTWDYVALRLYDLIILYPVHMLNSFRKLNPSNPQCSLAYGRRPHPFGVLPQGPLAHPPLAASGALRLGEHNLFYRKLLCAISVGTIIAAGPVAAVCLVRY